MADEKPATPVVDEGAKAEAAYRSTLAKMVTGTEDDAPAEPEKKPSGDEEKKDEKPAEENGEDTSTDEEGDKEEKEEDATTDEEGDKEGGEDGDKQAEAPEEQSKYSKAFRKLQQQEAQLQAFKGQVLQYERQLQEREHRAQQSEEELKSFIRELKVDPFDTLFRNGLINEEEAEHLAKMLYYRSRAAAADPRSRAEAERLRREQAMRMESLDTKRAIARLEQERANERRQAETQRELDAYASKLEALVDTYKAKTPLLGKAWEKDSAGTREELYEVATRLGARSGEYPDPFVVIQQWLKERKRILAQHGITEPVATTKQDKSKPAAEKKGPSNGKTASSKASTPITDEEKEAAYQKELRARLNGTYVGD